MSPPSAASLSGLARSLLPTESLLSSVDGEHCIPPLGPRVLGHCPWGAVCCDDFLLGLLELTQADPEADGHGWGGQCRLLKVGRDKERWGSWGCGPGSGGLVAA